MNWVYRGGSWDYFPRFARFVTRSRLEPDARYERLSFRIARGEQ